MKVREIKEKLDELKITYKPQASKGELEGLLSRISNEPSDVIKDHGSFDNTEYPLQVNAATLDMAESSTLLPVIYNLSAKFKAVDEEGNKIMSTHQSEGNSLAEALQKLEFPLRINALIKVSVKKGDQSANRSFASHKWNYIYENKDAKELGRLLGI